MNDIKPPKNTKTDVDKRKSLTIRINKTLALVIGVIILVAISFFAGKSYGSGQHEKTLKPTNEQHSNSAASQNRWTSVGTVTEVSDTKIKVKDARSEIKEAVINKDTKIVDRKGETLKTSDIKNDQRVVLSGDKDDKGTLTVTRIRIQQ